MKRKQANFPLYEIGSSYCFSLFSQTACSKTEVEKELYSKYQNFKKNIKLYLRYLK